MIQDFLSKAKRGEPVYITDVRDAFEHEQATVECVTSLTCGGDHRFTIRLPNAQNAEEEAFVREYFYACVYNLISTLGGKSMSLYTQNEAARALCKTLTSVFQVSSPKAERDGYGKCLNVTDRVNASLGYAPFSFRICDTMPDMEIPPLRPVQAVKAFRCAVKNAGSATLCGVDIGGTDIKVVGIQDGKLKVVKEYDWFPASFATAEQIIEPILLLVRVVAASLGMPADVPPDTGKVCEAMLSRRASDAQMLEMVSYIEQNFGSASFDGIGVCFPDVVVNDMIVGGETHKTSGMRKHSDDYDTEFAKLAQLKTQLLQRYCRPGGVIHMSNDGSLAAYTAAVELAHSEMADTVPDGVFAHTLGTELGTGWIDESGEIPQIPLEVYNCIIDLGNYPAREFDMLDARSVRNFNTGLPGTLQKYASQSGAYRLALRYFQKDAPKLYKELFSEGFLEDRDGGVYVVSSPKDMRKPLLEHLMTLCDAGNPQAKHIFTRIGEYMAVTWRVTEDMLAPRTKARILFGRFIKRERCFARIQEGAAAKYGVSLTAANDELAYTPIMRELEADPDHTVAQFAQAVGAAYFAASVLQQTRN